ncbi:MAG: Rpp14/Pop5 family protein [Candidatus Nanohaloarchaea archaeon]
MKPLPAAIREKERYLRFRVRSQGEVEFGQLVETIWDETIGYLGATGASKANIWIVKNRFDAEQQTGVIKFSRDSQKDVRAALTQINGIGGEKCFLEVEKVSGSIEQL